MRTPSQVSGEGQEETTFTTNSLLGEDAPIVIAPVDGLDGWTVIESGGTAEAKGTVTAIGGDLVLNEGDSFLVGIEKTITIGSDPSSLQFDFSPPDFDDVEAGAMRDAFEVSLVDAQGKSLVPTIGTGRDSFLNITSGLADAQVEATGVTVTTDSETGNMHVLLDLPTSTAGKTARFVMRLVNNDADDVSDSNTTVRLKGTSTEEEGPAITVPGSPETMTTLTFKWESGEASYPSEVGFVVVDGLSGRIDDLSPSTSNGYFREALSSNKRHVIFSAGDGPGSVTQVSLPGGTKIFQYVVQNSTTEQALAANPSGNQSAYPRVYFQGTDANPDSEEHFSLDDSVSGVTEVAIEYGADSPFDDLVYSIRSDVPVAPTALTASPVSGQPTHIALAWTDNASGENGFKVEQSTDGKTFTDITPTPLAANSTSHTVTGLTAGASYFFRVRAYNSNGNSAFSNTAALPPGYAVGHWSFGEGSGTLIGDSGADSIVNDGTRMNGGSTASSGNGPSWTTRVTGNNALHFDGIDDSVQVADSNNLDLTSALSIGAWIKLDDVGNEDFTRIVSKKYEWDDAEGYELLYTHGPDQLIFAGAGVGHYAFADVSLDDEWHHVAVTVNGTRVQLYVDGEPVETQGRIDAIVTNSEPLRIGANGEGTGYYFEGSIDDVRLYDRPLSSLEIESLAADPGSTKFFVVDGTGEKTYRYDSAGNPISNTALDSATTTAKGAASNVAGDKLWTVDAAGIIRSYTAGGTLNGTWTATDVETPTGIATDGMDIWIVDADSDKVLRYAGAASRTSGSIAATSTFDLVSENSQPSDVVAVDGKFWVSDDSADAIFVYGSSNGLLRRWNLDSNNADPSGITLDPSVGLAPASRYTVTVTATDLASNEMDPLTWSFTTTSEEPHSIWNDSNGPTVPSEDDSPVEVGVKFRSNAAGYITGLRFYKEAANTGTHVGHLWQANGTLLATATFSNESTTGWQTVHFDTPAAISANTSYVASYFAPHGNYSASSDYFAGAGASDGTLTALADGVDGDNGLFTYDSGGGFPDESYQSTNYWVDVLYQATTADLTPPVITSQLPAPDQGDAQIYAPIRVQFDKQIEDSTLSFVLTNASNVPVSASVSYDEASRTATLTPSSALTFGASYTVTISGEGTNGYAIDEQSWSFTAASTSIWSNSATPSVAADSDPNPVEIGVKFRSTSAGYITGLRFYKGTGNSGTHVGHLWSAGGTELASATFTDETATGWQTVYFDEPIAISANTTYVASYYAPSGHYAVDDGYFTSSGATSGPVTALASGVDGNNGVFTYDTGGGLPDQSYNSGNYWVDVVYSATDTAAPAVVSRTPANGLVDISKRTNIAARFNEPIDPESLEFTVEDSAGNVVPATVSYDPLTRTASLTPVQRNDFLWVVDRTDKLIYRYEVGRDQRSGSLSAVDALPLDSANTNPEGIADPSGASLSGAPTRPVEVASVEFEHGRTSYNLSKSVVFSELTITPTEDLLRNVQGRLILAIQNISEVDVSVVKPDGFLPDRTPYIDLSSYLDEDEDGFPTLEDPIDLDLAFNTPQGNPFTYDLKVITQANAAPAFTSNPFATEQGQAYVVDLPGSAGQALEITAKHSNSLQYVLTGADPDGDDVEFELLSGPDGMSIETVGGKPTLQWQPSNTDVGSHYVRLRIKDSPYGSFDPSKDQAFNVRVLSSSAENRAPRFTTDPVLYVYYGKTYSYQAAAFDPDGETLAFSSTSGPSQGEFAVDEDTGLVTWTPTKSQVGNSYQISLQVSDQVASPNRMTDSQEFKVVVLADTNNDDPIFTSEPVVEYAIGEPRVATATIPYANGGWKYKQIATSAQSSYATFMQNTYDDSAFSTGAAPFGAGYAGIPGLPAPVTNWPINTTMLMRREFQLPAGGIDFQLSARFDNFIEIWLNGVEITDGRLGATDRGSADVTTPTVFDVDSELLLPGTNVIAVRAADEGGITYADVQFECSAFRAIPDREYYYDASASDSNGDTLSYSLVDPPVGMTIDSATGEIVWPVPGGYALSDTSVPVTIRADDGKGGSALQIYDLDINGVAATKSISGTVFTSAGTFDGVNVFLDLNHDDVRDPTEPTDLTSSTGEYSFADLLADRYSVRVDAPEGWKVTQPSLQRWDIDLSSAGTDQSGVDFTVRTDEEISFVFDPPAFLSEPLRAISVGQTYEYKAEVTSPSGTGLLFELIEAPRGMMMDPEIGRILWRPKASQKGAQHVVLKASDYSGGSVIQEFSILVSSVAGAPTILSEPSSLARAGYEYTYQVVAQDPNGSALIYTLDDVSTSQGVDLDIETGLLTWTPVSVGTIPVEITVTNTAGGVDRQSYYLQVVNVNTPPRITSTPKKPAFVGQEWTYTVHAEDYESGSSPSEHLTFSLDPQAERWGFEIDSTTGVLTWTPSSKGVVNAVVRVTDANGAVGTQLLTVTANQPLAGTPNRPPHISSKPSAAATKNVPWQYRVKASDPDGDNVELSLVSFKDASGSDVSSSAYTILYFDSSGTELSQSAYHSSSDRGDIIFKWTPTSPVATAMRLRFAATDSHSAQELQDIELPVLGNSAPFVVRGVHLAGGAVGAEGSYSFDLIDYNGDDLTYRLFNVNGDTIAGQSSHSLSDASDDPGSPSTVTVDFTPTEIGTTHLKLRISDGLATTEHSFDILVADTSVQQPSAYLAARNTAAAGELFSAQVIASDPQNDTLEYSLDFTGTSPDPTGMEIDSATGLITWRPSTGDISGSVTSPYQYKVVISDGNSAPLVLGPLSLLVVNRFVNTAPTITSSADGLRASKNRPFIYRANAVDSENDTLTWSLVDGPITATINRSTGEFIWQPSPDEFDQSQSAQIQVTDPYGATSFQRIVLKAGQSYLPENTPPRIISTPPQMGPRGQTHTYIARAVDTDGERLTFDVINTGSGGVTFVQLDDHTAQYQWVRSTSVFEVKEFTVVVRDERGALASQVVRSPATFATGSGAVDTPPSITSTPTWSVEAGEDYHYQVVAADPDGAIAYTLDDGGSSVEIDPDTGLLTGETNTPGDYVIIVTATQNGVSAHQRFSLQVTDPNANDAPQIESASGLHAALGEHFKYQIVATDAESDPITYWLIDDASGDETGNLVSQVDGLVISSSGLVTWTVPLAATLERDFTVRAVDPAGAYSEETFTIELAADQSPTLSLRPSTRYPAAGTAIGFSVQATDDVGIADLFVVINDADWESGPVTIPVNAEGVATYTLPADAAGESFTVVATAIDSAGHSVSTSSLTVNVTPVDTSKPVVVISSIASGAVIDSVTPVLGRVYDPDDNLVSYTVRAIPTSGGEPIIIEQVTDATPPLASIGETGSPAEITTINPKALPNGAYRLEVSASDTSGKVTTQSVMITIQSGSKLGNFSLSFNDLNTTVGNVPISITRTYDSQKANQQGDFGYGWTLGLTNKSRIDVDLPSGPDPVFGPGWERAYQYGTHISVAMPDGTQRGFTTVLIPDTSGDYGAGAYLSLGNMYLVAFLPDADSRDARLEFDGGQRKPLRIEANGDIPKNLGLPDSLTDDGFTTTLVYYDDATGELRSPLSGGGSPFNPVNSGWKFRLVQPDGSSYIFDPASGELRSASDIKGNTLKYSNGGDTIESIDSAGTSLAKVVITRNGKNQVESVSWNDGDPLTTDLLQYGYSSTTGDLTSFTDRNGAVTFYEYNTEYDPEGEFVGVLGREHFLTRITDAERNVPTLTAVFGTDPEASSYGRLMGLLDASGSFAGIDYKLELGGGKTGELITDALGGQSEVVRDARGNVLRQIKQTGEDKFLVTAFTYDSMNNQISATKPYEVEDIETAETGSTSGIDLASQTAYNNPAYPHLPTSVTDADDKTTTYQYDARGNVTQVVDPLGNATFNTYNSDGYLEQTSDAGGGVTKYEYDAKGNLTKALQRAADGTFVTVATNIYNSLSQLTSTTDTSGFVRHFEYDARGRQVAAWFKGVDNTVVRNSTEYDNEGRVTATEKRVGGTEVAHGANGTLVASSSTSYDVSGRVLSSTDNFGHTTTTRYDVRGNVVETRSPSRDETGDEVAVVTRTAYDANGRVVATSDPFVEGVTSTGDLRLTHTIYDAAGRVIETRRVKGIAISLSYVSGGSGADHLGGIFASAFDYDAGDDEYGSTPASSVVLSSTQTHYDDEGRVDYTTSETGLRTDFEYDAVGRQTSVSYDIDLDGDSTDETVSTSYTYDDAGRQHTMTDPAGRVTEYGYDGLGRLTASILRGSTTSDESDDIAVRTIYDGRGRKIGEIDALGRQTDYAYDDAGRLASVTLPPVDDATTLSTALVRPLYSYEYDAQGNQTAIVDPKGNRTEFTYDSEGRQLTRTLPVGVASTGTATDFVETNTYVSASEATNASGDFYKMYGMLKYSEDFEGRVTAYHYDTDEEGITRGRLTGKSFYDDLSDYTGNSPARIINYTFDSLGRQVEVDDSEFTSSTTYAYDAEGRVTQISSPQGDLHYAYDDLGRKIATWSGSGSDLTSARSSATTLTEYAYDELSRLVQTKAVRRFGANVDIDTVGSGNQPEITSTVFAEDGQIDYELLSTTGSSLVTSDRVYDSQGRIEKLQHFVDADSDHIKDTGETLLSGFVYTYNKDGSKASEVATNEDAQSTTTSWTYDNLNRLTVESLSGYDGAGVALAYTDTYGFDLSGNRVKLDHNDQTAGTVPGSTGPDAITTSSYDANDRLLTETKDVPSNGSLDRYMDYAYGTSNSGTDQTGKTVYQGEDDSGTLLETTTYSYDAMGRMSQVSIDDGSTTTTVNYLYDANGFRVERTQGGTTTIYHVDPSNPTGYAQVFEEGTDADADHRLDAGEVAKAYTLGMQILTQATASQVLRLLYDTHGSNRAVLDAAVAPGTSAILQNFVYSAYGVDLALSGPLTSVRYSGQMIDALTGLSFNRARWYEPGIGSFKQLDPLRSNASTTRYLHNYLYTPSNPVAFSDSSGLYFESVQGLIGVITIQAVLFAQVALPYAIYAAAAAGAVYVLSSTAIAVDETYFGGTHSESLYTLRDASQVVFFIAYLFADTAQAFALRPTPKDVQRQPVKTIQISKSRYPQSAQHIEDAQKAGKPTLLTVDRSGAAQRRADALRGTKIGNGDRDEYPPAVFEEGGTGASVRIISASDNRAAGASMGQQLKGVPDGAIIGVEVIK